MAKLLIIDDERGIRNTLREILADEGHEVDVAENGKQGLEMTRQKAYDLIFSDIKMPEMDGRSAYCYDLRSWRRRNRRTGA